MSWNNQLQSSENCQENLREIKGPAIYTRSNPNQVASSGPQGFCIRGLVLLNKCPPTVAFGPLYTVYKNKCSDKSFD